jgi:PAP2 superfamily
LDLYAYSFDGSLGFQPSFVVGRWFQDYPVVQAVGRFTYYSLPLAMALVYAAHLRLRKTAPLFIFEIFMAAGLLGYFLYLTFPAAGPVYLVGSAFPGFPLSLSDLRALPLRTIPISVAIPRNAMPSLHLTWALLIWFNSKPLRVWQAHWPSLWYLQRFSTRSGWENTIHRSRSGLPVRGRRTGTLYSLLRASIVASFCRR